MVFALFLMTHFLPPIALKIIRRWSALKLIFELSRLYYKMKSKRKFKYYNK
jgi:hypothetical protein